MSMEDEYWRDICNIMWMSIFSLWHGEKNSNELFPSSSYQLTYKRVVSYQVVSPELVSIWLSSKKRQQDK